MSSSPCAHFVPSLGLCTLGLDSFFDLVWRKAATGASCRGIVIPDTICYYSGNPQPSYYFTSKQDRSIYKKRPQLTTSPYIYESFMKGRRKQQGACDIVAQYMSERPIRDSHGQEKMVPVIEYLDEKALEAFLFQRPKRGNGILQKFVHPKGTYNAIIRAHWTPQVCLLERKVNIHRVYDHRIDRYSRAVTMDGPEHLSVHAPITSKKLATHIQQLCTQIAEHIRRTSPGRMQARQMTLYFKMDNDDQVWLLWCSGMTVAGEISSKLSSKKPLPEIPEFTMPPEAVDERVGALAAAPDPFSDRRKRVCAFSRKSVPAGQGLEISVKSIIYHDLKTKLLECVRRGRIHFGEDLEDLNVADCPPDDSPPHSDLATSSPRLTGLTGRSQTHGPSVSDLIDEGRFYRTFGPDLEAEIAEVKRRLRRTGMEHAEGVVANMKPEIYGFYAILERAFRILPDDYDHECCRYGPESLSLSLSLADIAPESSLNHSATGGTARSGGVNQRESAWEVSRLAERDAVKIEDVGVYTKYGTPLTHTGALPFDVFGVPEVLKSAMPWLSYDRYRGERSRRQFLYRTVFVQNGEYARDVLKAAKELAAWEDLRKDLTDPKPRSRRKSALVQQDAELLLGTADLRAETTPVAYRTPSHRKQSAPELGLDSPPSKTRSASQRVLSRYGTSSSFLPPLTTRSQPALWSNDAEGEAEREREREMAIATVRESGRERERERKGGRRRVRRPSRPNTVAVTPSLAADPTTPRTARTLTGTGSARRPQTSATPGGFEDAPPVPPRTERLQVYNTPLLRPNTTRRRHSPPRRSHPAPSHPTGPLPDAAPLSHAALLEAFERARAHAVPPSIAIAEDSKSREEDVLQAFPALDLETGVAGTMLDIEEAERDAGDGEGEREGEREEDEGGEVEREEEKESGEAERLEEDEELPTVSGTEE